MNIKQLLKKINLTLTEFCNLIRLSRPTLNNYIALFESNTTIPNKSYEQLFKILFKKEVDSKNEFLQLINDNIYLLESNKNSDDQTYELENLVLMEKIQKKMEKDLKGKNADNSIYKFINSALEIYGTNSALTSYIRYFLYLNGLRDLRKIKPNEKILISHLFPLMKTFSTVKPKKILKVNEEGFKEFEKRVEEIKIQRKKNREKINNFFKDKLNEEIKNQLNQGTQIENIDIDNILKNIKANINIEEIVKK